MQERIILLKTLFLPWTVYSGLPRGSVGKESACNPWEDPLEKGMATHSSIRAWRILWTEEFRGNCKESDMTEVTEHRDIIF